MGALIEYGSLQFKSQKSSSISTNANVSGGKSISAHNNVQGEEGTYDRKDVSTSFSGLNSSRGGDREKGSGTGSGSVAAGGRGGDVIDITEDSPPPLLRRRGPSGTSLMGHRDGRTSDLIVDLIVEESVPDGKKSNTAREKRGRGGEEDFNDVEELVEEEYGGSVEFLTDNIDEEEEEVEEEKEDKIDCWSETAELERGRLRCLLELGHLDGVVNQVLLFLFIALVLRQCTQIC